VKQIRTRIAGFNNYDGAPQALMGMRPQTRLVLKPEPTNAFDKNAIEIFTTSGLKLGYIPRVDNELVLSRLNDKGARVQCFKTSDTFNSIVLRYDVPEIDDDRGDPLA